MNRQQELDKKTDEEIERIVHDTLVGADSNLDAYFKSFRPKNYCSNPSDIMPIAFENDIEYWRNTHPKNKTKEYQAEVLIDGRDIKSINKNPLRAICIVFILMSEAKL